MKLFGQHPLAGLFNDLEPQQVMEAVEQDGRRCTGRAQILNSYENRVYQLELEDGEWVVAKFYRPGRWSEAAILEEHQFLWELEEMEIPIAAPLAIDSEGETLGLLPSGIYYALYPQLPGRIPEEFNLQQVAVLGRILARIHAVGAEQDALHRPRLDPESYGRQNLRWLLENDSLPKELRATYEDEVEGLLEQISPLFEGLPYSRIHGDCHRGNLLYFENRPALLDFDDLLMGPAVQDIWMLIPGVDHLSIQMRAALVMAYRQEHEFDLQQLKLIEPLRALRFIHYSCWIARRIHDPAFQRTFGGFGDLRYWQQEIQDLREQRERIR